MIALILAALVGCKTAAECAEDKPCGFGETCVEGKCVSRACATSAQCAMEQFCDGGTCRDGCQEDADCYPGDTCVEGACAAAACRSSTLDCDFKEFCDPSTGECYEASGYYCRACNSDEDCGGNGNYCWNFGLDRQFCGVRCEGSDDDCPSGFTCIPLDSEDGTVFQCVTYCWLYDDEAAGRVVAPPDPAEVRHVPGAAPVDPEAALRRDAFPTCSAE